VGVKTKRLSRLHRAMGCVAHAAVLVGSYSLPSDASAAAIARVTLVPSSLDLPDNLRAEQFREALLTASQRWSYPEVACTSVAIEVAETAARRRTERDGRSLFVFRSRRWCHNEQCGPGRTFPRLAAAMTTVYDTPSSTGGPGESDVELNTSAFDWSHGTSLTSAQPVAPLIPVLVHEIGHILGFQDTCGTRHGVRPDPGCPPNELESVMLSGSNREQLSAWDVARLCSRFPKSEARAARAEEPEHRTAPVGWWALAGATLLTAAAILRIACRKPRAELPHKPQR